MRIIVTNNGLKEILSNNPNSESPLRDHSPTIRAYKHRNRRSSMNSKAASSMRRNNSVFSSTASEINNLVPKVIELKKRKLNVPTNQGFLYESDHQIDPLIVKQMPEILNNISKSCISSSSLPVLKESYSLKELIPQECFDKLNNRLVHEHNLKNFDIKLDEKIYRNQKTGREIFDEISKAKEYQIDSNHTNLIEYLVGKKSVSERLLQNLASYEDKRINYLNKICQRVLVGNENEKLFQEKVKNKILSEKITKITTLQDDIETVKGQMNSANTIIDKKYKMIKEKNIYYKDVHFKLLQHWRNHNYDRFCFDNNQRKNKLCGLHASSKSDQYFNDCLPKKNDD